MFSGPLKLSPSPFSNKPSGFILFPPISFPYQSIPATLYLFTFPVLGLLPPSGPAEVILESDRSIYRPRVGVVLGNATQSSAWTVVYALGTLNREQPFLSMVQIKLQMPLNSGLGT